jgi:hypothetical protein
MYYRLLALWFCLLAAHIAADAQTPIDLSQAKEFVLVWKIHWGGRIYPPIVLEDFCGERNNQVLIVVGNNRMTTARTSPKLDTSTIAWWPGALPVAFDYDGVPPLEYINIASQINTCRLSYPPYNITPVDTILKTECWGGAAVILNPEFTTDIDGDGYEDLVCDMGGAGMTARVIRGGPNAGVKCERLLPIPFANHDSINRKTVNGTLAFWRSPLGKLRLLQDNIAADGSSAWVVLYDVDVRHEGGKIVTRFTALDSITGKGFGGPSHCAVVTDTVQKKDWLLIYRYLYPVGPEVLERFDVTDGRIVPTGEQVTRAVLWEPWNVGYAMGTQRPVIQFNSDIGIVFSYVDDLSHPFARWSNQGALEYPVKGMVMINDQTGDGKPDLIASGGDNNGGVALYTLDEAFTTSADDPRTVESPSVRLMGTTLVVHLTVPTVVSAQLISTEGRMILALPAAQGSAGANTYDLSHILGAQPTGMYLLRVSVGSEFYTLRFVR